MNAAGDARFVDGLLRESAAASRRRFEVGDGLRLMRGARRGCVGEVVAIWESPLGVSDWLAVRLSSGDEARATPSMLRGLNWGRP